MSIALASDHSGFQYKDAIRQHLKGQGLAVLDFGTHSETPMDYPDVVWPAAQAVALAAC